MQKWSSGSADFFEANVRIDQSDFEHEMIVAAQ